MINSLKQEALKNGDKLDIFSVEILRKLKEDIETFKKENKLNNFQNWITNKFYKLDLPDLENEINSIIFVAIPHPAYAKVEFIAKGKKYNLMSLVMSDFERNEKYFKKFVEKQGYKITSAFGIPLKRLAVRSGFAVYGKNNISYVENIGSFFSYKAYFSNIPCDDYEWNEIKIADNCNNCNICFNKCPTGAIKKEKILINNEKCLTYFNESPKKIPEWVSKDAHHCLCECLKCQFYCPMNKDHIHNVDDSIKFSEEETQMILSKKKYDEFSDDFKYKAKKLGINDFFEALPRNLKLLMDLEDESEGSINRNF
jgi:epoxyqueuosine reductase